MQRSGVSRTIPHVLPTLIFACPEPVIVEKKAEGAASTKPKPANPRDRAFLQEKVIGGRKEPFDRMFKWIHETPHTRISKHFFDQMFPLSAGLPSTDPAFCDKETRRRWAQDLVTGKWMN